METTIKIGDEFVKILQDNAFNGIDGADVVNHIAKVLEILEWIKIPHVDKDQLQLHVFPIPLSGHAREWWDNEIKVPNRSVHRIEFTKYAILFGRTDTLFRLHQSTRCLSRRFETSYLNGGYAVSSDLPEQST
ncbi:hypothetical protein Tco_1263978 [Tanacetum coccineum]